MTTPTEVFHQLVGGVAKLVAGDERQADALADLYAEQTHVTHPFAPAGAPTLRTREDLRRHFSAGPGAAAGRFRSFAAEHIVVHRTLDPEVVVAEFRYEGESVDGPFTVPCVFVLRVRDGQIVESRDYVHHLETARAAGRLDELVAALAQAPAAQAPATQAPAA